MNTIIREAADKWQQGLMYAENIKYFGTSTPFFKEVEKVWIQNVVLLWWKSLSHFDKCDLMKGVYLGRNPYKLSDIEISYMYLKEHEGKEAQVLNPEQPEVSLPLSDTFVISGKDITGYSQSQFSFQEYIDALLANQKAESDAIIKKLLDALTACVDHVRYHSIPIGSGVFEQMTQSIADAQNHILSTKNS